MKNNQTVNFVEWMVQVASTTVKRIFRDPYKEVTTTTLEKLARALGVPTADLIEDVPDVEKPE